MDKDDQPTVSVGKTVAGTYRIRRRIGKGGMGSVFEAEKISTHEVLAIKLISRAFVKDRTYVERFKREIDALRAIRHPNVVNVFEWSMPGEPSDDPPFLVMEMLEGRALDEVIETRGKLSVEEAVAVMLQVLDALSAAHGIGVIHRDLAASNIFLCGRPGEKPRVKLLDFGLTKPIQPGGESITETGVILGKAAYAAPELFHGVRLDERADIFACGMVMLKMLAGRLPYGEKTSQMMLWAERFAQKDDPAPLPSPRTYEPGVPEAIDRLVARALEKDPDRRYRTAREMQGALLEAERSLVGETTDEMETGEMTTRDMKAKGRTGQASPQGPAADAAPTIPVVPPAFRDPDATAPLAREPKIAARDAATREAATREAATRAVSAGDEEVTAEKKGKMHPAAVAALILAPVVLVVLMLVLLLHLGPGPGEGGPDRAPLSRNDAAALPGESEAPGPGAGAAEAGTVRIVVRGAPEGSAIRIGETLLRGDPPEARVPRGTASVLLEVSAEGYAPYRLAVVPDGDLDLFVALEMVGDRKKHGKTKSDGVIEGPLGTSIKTDYNE